VDRRLGHHAFDRGEVPSGATNALKKLRGYGKADGSFISPGG
jgi:hypothetical protein